MSNISNYVSNHWKGKHSLVKSFWLNMWLITFLSIMCVVLYNNLILHRLINHISSKMAGGLELAFFLFVGLFVATYIWGIVGTWRSASNVMQQKSKHDHQRLIMQKIWALIAVFVILLTVLDIIFSAHSFIPTWVDIIGRSMNHLF